MMKRGNHSQLWNWMIPAVLFICAVNCQVAAQSATDSNLLSGGIITDNESESVVAVVSYDSDNYIDPVLNLVATATSATSITLTWDLPPGTALDIRIARSAVSSTSGFSLYDQTAVTATSYVDNSVVAGTTYYYFVRLVDSGGSSDSEVVSATPTNPGSPPAAPGSLLATAISTTEITLSWTDNSTDEDNFIVERSLTGSTYTQLVQLGADVVTYTDNTLSPNQTAFYKVLARNAAGDSAPAGPASATTNDTPPADPTILTATATSSSSINLTWQDNASDETAYEVHRSLSSGSGFSLISTEAANTASYTNTGLSGSTTYYYKVKAIKGGLGSGFSNEANATTPAAATVPAAPVNLVATAVSTTSIDLTWSDQSGNEDNFVVLRSFTSGTGYSELATLAANTQSYTDASLSANQTAYYQVLARNAQGDSGPTAEVSATTLDTPPADPSLLVATTVSTSEISLTWQDNSTDETGFEIHRSLSASTGFTLVSTQAAGTVSFNNTGLSASTTYYYKVRAIKGSLTSGFTATANATTNALPTVPASPTILTATALSSTEISLSWQDNAGNEVNYLIERSSTAGSGFAVIATLGADVQTFTDNTLSPVQTAYYRVRAENAQGFSGYTAEVSATTNDIAPAAPQNLVATVVSTTEISLTWDDVSNNETDFIIQRSFTSGSGYVQIATVLANVESFNDTGLTQNQTAFYIVKAKNAIGESIASNEATATTDTEIVTDGLGVYLNVADVASFDGSGSAWNDISGNNFTGTLGNTVSLDGAHLFFDGRVDQDGLSMPNVQVLALDKRFSIGFWIRPISQQNWNQSLGGLNSWGGFWFHTDKNGSIYAGITSDDSNGRFSPADIPNGTMELYQWQYFTFTFNNGSAKLFKNGIELAAKTLVNPISDWNGFRIANGHGNYEQIHIYPNKELTAAEVMQNFNADKKNFKEQLPFKGITRNLPGILEAEFFDEGGQGLAYNDLLSGPDQGDFRKTEAPYCSNDQLGGYHVGNIADGEWLEYTVEVTAGLYNIDFNAAKNISGTTNITLSVDGLVVGSAGVTSTGGSTTYQNFTMSDIFIAGGTKVLRLAFDGAVNINKMNFDAIGTIPNVPTNLGTATISNSLINLGWKDNSDNETSFEIYRSNSVDGPFTLLTGVAGNVESYADNSVISGNIYYYKVSAKNEIGESGFSNVAEGNPDVITLAPEAPTNLTAASISGSEIKLDWMSNSSNETGFDIHRSLTAGSGYALVATTDMATATYTDNGLLGSTKYYYRVRAVNVAGSSVFSNEISATTQFIFRVDEGLQVLYNFKEGSGNTVNDISNSGTPMNLTIANTGNVQWLTGQGLRTINTGTIINAAGDATKIINAVKASNEITLEAWIEVDNPDANGPARILTISFDGSFRGAMVGQNDFESPATGDYFFTTRLNTSDPSVTDNGLPNFSTNETFQPSELKHVVYTRNISGVEQIYVDGVSVETGTRAGDFSSWASNYKLALADENTSGARNWFGAYYLVAVYSKALTLAEVQQNYAAGNDVETVVGNIAFTINTTKLPSLKQYDIEAYGLTGTFNSGGLQVFNMLLTESNPQSVLINIIETSNTDPYAIKFDASNDGTISNFNVVDGIQTVAFNSAYFNLEADNEIVLNARRDVVINDPGIGIILENGLMLTPDGDGIFDELVVNGLENVTSYAITITDLLDATIYQSTDKNQLWDGTDNTASIVAKGIYKYEITADGQTIKGQFIIDYN